MISKRTLLAAIVVALGSSQLLADELLDETRALCDNIKTCALEQIASEELTVEMRQMMEPMLENMCSSMSSKIEQVPTEHGLYKPAVACVRSMQSLSCEQMQDPDHQVTPECQEYEERASKLASDG